MSWQRIKGHDPVVRSFQSAWQRGRVGQAYLFVGPSGVGKHTFARELAKALLCEGRKAELEACDACTACTLVDAGTHPDLFTASRPEESVELPIEVIRELCVQLAMKPARGARKVAILDDADDLNEASANCFLKTLEEPPPGSVLILVGGNLDRQLATIVSRCQVVRFPPLPPAVIADVLAGQGVTDPARAERLIRLSGGSVGQALALDDADLWEFRQTLLDGLTGPRPDVVELAEKWSRFTDEAGKDAGSQRRRASLVVRLLVEMIENALRLAHDADAPGLDPKERAALKGLGDRLGAERLLALLERALDADVQIDRKVQLVLVQEALMDAFGREMVSA